MYHAEKVIDGILHYKSTPKGSWVPYTQEQLTQKIVKLEAELKQALYI